MDGIRRRGPSRSWTAGLLLMRARANDPLTLALAGWAAVVLGFWLLAILTAIEMRASLAAQPLVAILAGLAIARAAQDGRWARVAAAAAIASIVLRAVSDWTGCLGLSRILADLVLFEGLRPSDSPCIFTSVRSRTRQPVTPLASKPSCSRGAAFVARRSELVQ